MATKPKSKSPATRVAKSARSSVKATLDARPDTVDFRDQMYVPTLVEVPIRMPLETYVGHYTGKRVPILDQGQEGACTGFGLAAVANFLLHRRKVVPDTGLVSPRMFYEMARRYDEWPGEKYSGSSARGAMKGWHKHGVCADPLWPYDPKRPRGTLDHERAVDAAKRPLGAYFRVNHLELPAMHSALSEVGIVYATATVHEGWSEVDSKSGVIAGPEGKAVLGGHAFAVVGYDERGFWIQNSWGASWGKRGFALIGYDDWLANATDAWVARLGAPTAFAQEQSRTQIAVPMARADYAYCDLRPHVISVGNDGLLRDAGSFATTARDVQEIVASDFPRITAGWSKKRVLLYAHGGLVSESAALQRVEDYRRQLLDAEVYPLAFVWHSDAWSTLSNILKDATARRRPEGLLDAAKDFLLDRLDDTLEPLARPLGKALWDEMKENATLATTRSDGLGGARLVLDQLQALAASQPKLEIHVAGHSAGSIFMAAVVQHLATVLRKRIASVTLWAPACTMELFKSAYLPAIQSGAIEQFSLFTLKDRTEQDDNCAGIYHKSLLYLVSNALEHKSGLFFAHGEPLLGMERFITADPAFRAPSSALKNDPAVLPLFGLANAEWIRSPNTLPEGGESASASRHHGDFDDDHPTVRATLARILGRKSTRASFDFRRSEASLQARRRRLG